MSEHQPVPERQDASPDPASPGPVSSAPFGIDPKLLEILVCPLTKATLEYDADKQELISRQARLAYPIRDGIPIMLPEEARQLPD
ncbi:Trm112 family protein [Saliniramus sp.]|uniref:Trm112 family protein n=1 Tax=Saliniramus sp. TaxID=2986772 RepID=UPI002CEE0F03|nr:Trm112 family protein [Saliniramus sp.]HMB10422.1 Trm112 family protein [Saliniramus sp.]